RAIDDFHAGFTEESRFVQSQVFLRLVSSRHCLALLRFDIQSDVVPPMSEQGEQPELRIAVIGTFRVLAPNDEDLTPRGRKARALLAILALTPTRRRSRPALQDKLWSDRGPEQGAASLRQTLTEIRRAFGEFYRDYLISDMRGVGLAQDRVVVD